MLAVMFSGRHTLTPDEDGSYWTIQVELNTFVAEELAIEAEFCGLTEMAAAQTSST